MAKGWASKEAFKDRVRQFASKLGVNIRMLTVKLVAGPSLSSLKRAAASVGPPFCCIFAQRRWVWSLTLPARRPRYPSLIGALPRGLGVQLRRIRCRAFAGDADKKHQNDYDCRHNADRQS